MENINSKALVTERLNSPQRRENSNVKRALSDRLLLSEALEAVGRMVGGSPYRSQAGDSYIGTIAQLLMEYPRLVATKCADPLRGVARETKFLPTVAEIVAWCEREVGPMHQESVREDRVKAQLEARDAWQIGEKDPKLLEKIDAWLDRTDPVAAELSGAKAKGALRQEARDRLIAQIGQDAFNELKDAPPRKFSDSTWKNMPKVSHAD